ncbi:hypothetical protein [Actinokineospora inagensis]|uniref:hypothetical protein n=1 Tax=Actinokineospora inagensis TaxID=103730 RepID=UPI0003F55B68|nr:hypothetical protein [Actinokineospora inagensis]
MADPVVPVSGDFSAATYEQILFAVTGLGGDLHAVADGGTGTGEAPNAWLKFAAPGSAANNYGYQAWDTYYFGVDVNTTALNSWSTAYHAIDGMVPRLASGKAGLMDVPLLREATQVTDKYVRFLELGQSTTKRWADDLGGDDADLKGKAAYAIQANLERLAFTFGDVHRQLTLDRVPGAVAGLAEASLALRAFGQNMAQIWYDHRNALLNSPVNNVNNVLNSVNEWVVDNGLDKSTKDKNPPYQLDDYYANGGKTAAEEYIRSILSSYRPNLFAYPMPAEFNGVAGSLMSAGLWDAFNQTISSIVLTELSTMDQLARTEFAKLEAAYRRSGKGLVDLKTNQPPTVGSLPPDVPDASLIGAGGLTPPDGSVGGTGGIGDPTANLPGGGAAGSVDFPLTNGASGGANLPNGGTSTVLPGGGTTGTTLPVLPGGGLVLPTLPGTTTGDKSTGTLPNGSHPTTGDDGWTPSASLPGQPRKDQVALPSTGSAGGSAHINPVSTSDGATLPALSGGGAGGGAPDSWGGTGGGVGAPGSDAFDAGSPTGWSNWAGNTPNFNTIAPEAAGLPGTVASRDTSSGLGGMPFMPPMAGGGAGGNREEKERDRETWLSEDEEFWGTESQAGFGVLGHPDLVAPETDEPVAARHVHLRTAAPVTRKPIEDETAPTAQATAE